MQREPLPRPSDKWIPWYIAGFFILLTVILVPMCLIAARTYTGEVTEHAYENPVFVEDLVRNVALKLNAHPRVTWYKVEAENFESIHNHNAYACIEKG